MSAHIQTPYGPKTPELLCKAMDAYEREPELLAALDAAESILSSYGLMDHAQAIRARALLARLKGDK